MAFLRCNSASTYLLVALSLSGCLKACDGILKEDSDVPISRNTTRPQVTIYQGTIQGVNMVTHRGREIFGFKGIPFAQPPVGNLRFMGPVAAQPWHGTLDASNDVKPCPQVKGEVVIGDEDCLYLNVYTPRLPAGENSTLLPVVVYVFGGGFRKGSPTSKQWGPHFILDKDVVLVVPNYRLGVLGFLSTGDEVSPGNYGLKDLLRALEWNRDNIQFFGGDPSQVTLAGGSSGAMSVHLLTLSNLTNGLFHKYITQSGSALSPEAVRPKDSVAKRATQLGEYFGCPTHSSISLVMCLRSIDVSWVVKSDAIFYVWATVTVNVWGPTVEPEIEGAIITDTPANLLAAGKFRDLPWLSSVTNKERAWHTIGLYKNADMYQDFRDKIDIILPLYLFYDDLVNNATAYTATLKTYYLNYTFDDRFLFLNNVTQLIGDDLFHYPMYSAAQQYLAHAKSPLYVFSFEYRGTFSHSYSLTGGDMVNWGAVHGDECIYLFQAPEGFFGPPECKMNESDWKMVDTMVELWTSFVINGTPAVGNQNSTIIWEPYSTRRGYLQVGSNSDVSLEVKYNFFGERVQFWEELSASTSWK